MFSMFSQVFELILSGISRAFGIMSDFKLVGDLSLLHFLIILIILEVVLKIFVPSFTFGSGSNNSSKSEDDKK